MIPEWIHRRPSIWVTDIEGLDPRMPTGAVIVHVREAVGMGGEHPVPEAVQRAWALGAEVECPCDAPPMVHEVAARLRDRLPMRMRVHLRSIAATLGLPRVGAAMATLGNARPSELGQALIDEGPDGSPHLGLEARLLLALDGL
ncbi:MAG: hypothetical protein AAGA54_06175 [Myxococcota bacterium]